MGCCLDAREAGRPGRAARRRTIEAARLAWLVLVDGVEVGRYDAQGDARAAAATVGGKVSALRVA